MRLIGPDKYQVPSPSDPASIPDDLVSLIESMRPSLVGQATSVAERTRKYGTPPSNSSPNSIQAPEGTLVVSKEMSAIWIKTSSTRDEWYALMRRADPVTQEIKTWIPPDQRIPTGEMVIPETGVYSLSATFSGRHEDKGAGVIREPQLLVNGRVVSATVNPPTAWWTFTGTAVVPCRTGDRFATNFMQRGSSPFNVWVAMTYQRIL